MGRGIRRGIAALIGAGLLAGIWARARRGGAGEAGEEGSFAGSISCRTCHADVFEAWKTSDHAEAQGPAEPSRVRGRFEGERLEHFGAEARFERHDGAFFVRTEGADGRPGIFRVSEVIGVDPLQQYLVELDRGCLQTLPFCWDTRRGRWFHAYPDERIDAGDALHWTRPAQTWNYMCADCHVTGYRKNF